MIKVKLYQREVCDPNTNAACPVCGDRLVSDREYVWCCNVNQRARDLNINLRSFSCNFGVREEVTIKQYLDEFGFIEYVEKRENEKVN